MTAINLTGVCADYGGPAVLDHLDLQAQSGELLAVLGASGSGKTTLLRILAGFVRPTAGQVALGDRIVVGPSTWVPPERRRIGIVPQEGALFPHLDVAANVAFGLPRGSSGRVAEMLELVGMADMGSRRPHELSGGQQQRVALARALAPMPEVVCMDEPFAALDAYLRERLREEVRAILRACGTTAVLVTHDQEEALSMADRIAVIRDGRVAQSDEPRRMYQHPVDLDLARFVGSVVELPGTIERGHLAATALGLIEVDGEHPPGTRGTVVLRPEQIRLSPSSPGHPGTATVLSAAYFGHSCLVRARLDGGTTISVRVPGYLDVQPGASVATEVIGSAILFDLAQP